MKKHIKIPFLFAVILFFVSCNKKLDQNNMFQGRTTTNNKKGHYDTGVRRNKPMSVQYADESRKENKDATNPKKLAKAAEKEIRKKKIKSQREREKHNKKVRQKVKTTNGKATGGGQ